MAIAPPPSDIVADQQLEQSRLMAIVATGKKALLQTGDDEADGEMGEPAIAPITDIKNDPLITALYRYAEDGYVRGMAAVADDHAEWAVFQRMKDGHNPDDDDPDPLVTDYDVWFAFLAKLTRTFKAIVLQEFLEDPATMDFFTVRARKEGIENLADKWKAIVQEKLRSMEPEDAQHGFAEVADMHLDDFLTFGNLFGAVSHDAVMADDGSIESEGAVAEWLDPFNCYPWMADVNNISQTPVSIYSPLNDEQLDNQGYPAEIVNLIRKEVQAGTVENRNPESGTDGNLKGEPIGNWYQGGRYKRIVTFSWFPTFDLMRDSGLNKTLGEDDPYESAAEWILRLASFFKFDPEKAFDEKSLKPARWWRIEHIGPFVCMVEPYPLALPKGQGPVIHQCMIKRNGKLLGQGLYHVGQWDERFGNYFRRAELTLTALQIDPPAWYDRYALDQKWLQDRGGELDLERGTRVPVTNPSASLSRPIEPMDIGSTAAPYVNQGILRAESSLRENTGVHTSLEGQDKSRTATQSANNLQQNMMEVAYFVRRLACGYLEQIVRRVYVATRQVMQMSGMVQAVPVSSDEGLLTTLYVMPDEMLPEELIEFKVNIGNPMSSLQDRIEAMDRWVTKYMPMGLVDIQKAARAEAQLAKIPSLESLLVTADPMEVQRMITNASALGPAGVQMLPAYVQQMLFGAPMQGSVPGQEPPGGEKKGTAPGGRQGATTKAQPMGSATSAGAPMMGGGGA